LSKAWKVCAPAMSDARVGVAPARLSNSPRTSACP
jgi:hypothetical protein